MPSDDSTRNDRGPVPISNGHVRVGRMGNPPDGRRPLAREAARRRDDSRRLGEERTQMNMQTGNGDPASVHGEEIRDGFTVNIDADRVEKG
jgi:hypothetical protein